MEKKSSVFKPDVKGVDNNKKVYYSFLDDNLDVKKSEEDPRAFIDKLDNDGSYIFSKKVIIKTKDKTYDTKIAGKIKDKIITTKSQVIPIDSIISIYEK